MSDRKARLKALTARAGRKKKSNSHDDSNSATEEREKITFRNYTPNHASLSNQEQQFEKEDYPSAPKRLRPGDSYKTEFSSSNENSSSSSKALKNALEQAQRDPVESAPISAATHATNHTNDVSVISMVPRKSNWDLKRDIDQKLQKLERRTQIAIVRMLKERLELEAVNAINDGIQEEGHRTDLE